MSSVTKTYSYFSTPPPQRRRVREAKKRVRLWVLTDPPFFGGRSDLCSAFSVWPCRAGFGVASVVDLPGYLLISWVGCVAALAAVALRYLVVMRSLLLTQSRVMSSYYGAEPVACAEQGAVSLLPVQSRVLSLYYDAEPVACAEQGAIICYRHLRLSDVGVSSRWPLVTGPFQRSGTSGSGAAAARVDCGMSPSGFDFRSCVRAGSGNSGASSACAAALFTLFYPLMFVCKLCGDM
uniref:Uncharacterized protein n=1 Tax=Glossina pallidipes TaxID=7398 RepID=A0A1B0ACY6_GLOPL